MHKAYLEAGYSVDPDLIEHMAEGLTDTGAFPRGGPTLPEEFLISSQSPSSKDASLGTRSSRKSQASAAAGSAKGSKFSREAESAKDAMEASEAVPPRPGAGSAAPSAARPRPTCSINVKPGWLGDQMLKLRKTDFYPEPMKARMAAHPWPTCTRWQVRLHHIDSGS